MADNVEVVKMEDGREVSFAGKRKALKSSFFEGGEVKVRIDFRNGESRVWTVPGGLVEKAACHGGEQKYGDSYASLEDVEDMITACEKVQSNLLKGDWSSRVEGSGIAGTSVLLRALMEYTGKVRDDVKAFLEGKTQADKLALRNSTRANKAGVSMKAIVERLEAEKIAKGTKVDTEALLNELGA